MKYTTQRLLWRVKLIALVVTLSAAANAAEVLRAVDPAQLAWWTWAFIMAFSTIGWAISELDKLAEILEPELSASPQQRVRALLRFSQSYIASLFAGIGIYFVAKVAPGWISMAGDIPEMIILLAVTASAYGGTRFLQWLLARFGFAAVTP